MPLATFLGGTPKLLVCDNLRAGVTAACRYEPGINRTYQERSHLSFHAALLGIGLLAMRAPWHAGIR